MKIELLCKRCHKTEINHYMRAWCKADDLFAAFITYEPETNLEYLARIYEEKNNATEKI